MSSNSSGNNIVKLIDAAHKKQAAQNALKAEIIKYQVKSKIDSQAKMEQTQNEMALKRQQEQIDNPQRYTPEQAYLKRRFMEENPLANMMVPEEGDAQSGQNLGITFPKDEIVRDPKTETLSQQPVGPDRQSQLLLTKVDQMIASGKKPHPAIMKLADIARQNLVNKNQQAAGAKGSIQQDRLEKTYTDRLLKVTSNRSGGLGLQDSKVNQAIHLRNLADQYKDPKSGQYNIPQSQLGEMLIGLANLVSNSSVNSVEQLKAITPHTVANDTSKLVSYWTGKPVTANTQEMITNILDSIDRQGVISEHLRDKYFEDFNNLAPTGLDPTRLSQLKKINIGNSFQEYLNSSNGGGHKKAVRTGTLDGKPVVEYDDGTVDYAA